MFKGFNRFKGFKKGKLKGLLSLICASVLIIGYQNCGDNGQDNFGSRKPASIILVEGLTADSIAKKSKTWNWDCGESNGDNLDCTYRFVVNQSDTHEFTDEPYGNQTSYTKSDGTGTFWLHVQAKDETGLESDVKSIPAILDNTKPMVSNLSSDPITRMSKAWNWGCNDETSPKCTYRFDVTTTRNHTFNNPSYGVTSNHTLSGGQGTYYLHVQAKDEAGNESEIKSVSVTLDTTKPAVTELTDDRVPTKSKTWTWNCDKAPCTYRFVVNNSSNHAFSPSDAYRTMSSPTTSKTSGTGTFWLHVQAKDSIGNESPVVSVSAVLDNALPVVTNLSSDSSPRQSKTWTWGCSKNNCTYRFAVNNSQNHTFPTTSNYGPVYTKTASTTDYGTGTVWLHVQARDSMNNESDVVSVSAVLNDTPLTVTRLSSDPTPKKSKTWNWSCSETPASNCTYRFAVNQSERYTFPANTAYGSTTTASQNSGDGTYYLHVQAKSAIKGESAVESVSVKLDNTKPTFTELADDNTVQSSKTWSWGCSETSPSRCEYRFVINKTATHTFTNELYGSTTTATQNSGDGTYYLHVQARDTAENESDVKSVSVTLDNRRPEVTELASDNTPTRSKTWNWSCSETPASNCTYRFAVNKSPSHAFTSFTPPSTSYGSTTTASQSSGDGTWYLHVQAKDGAGNESLVVSVSAVLDNTGPTLTGLSDDDTPAKSKTWQWSCNEACTYRYHIKQCEDSPPADDDSCKIHLFSSESYDGETTASQTGDGTYYIHVQARDGAGNESQVTSVSAELQTAVKALADGPFGDHNCALFTNNTVKCWGRNDFGQLGQGNVNDLGDGYSELGKTDLDPVNFGTKFDGEKYTVTSVSVGAYHSCVVLDDGSLKCWGLNYDGQLGLEDNGDTRNGNKDGKDENMQKIGDVEDEIQSTPTINLGTGRTAKAVSAGGYRYGTTGNGYRFNGNHWSSHHSQKSHTCALLDDNSVKCWGYNRYGQLGKIYNNNNINLGDDSSEMGDDLRPIDLGIKSDGTTKYTAKAVSAGGYHSCAILDDDSVKCWGFNNYGQLGQGDRLSRGDNQNEMGNRLPAVVLGTGRTAKAISAGADHTCALLDNNKIKCWGRNNYGQLGLGDTSNRGDFYQAATSNREERTEMGDSLPAVNLGTGRTAKAVSAGAYHTCALLDNDKIKCWGLNNYGQLGQDNTYQYGRYPITHNYYGMNNLSIIRIGGADEAKAVITGALHSCALLSNDGVKCWGYNRYGQLGLGNPNTYGDGRHNDRKMENLVEIPFY